MILTVTLNSCLDRVLVIDELTPGKAMAAHKEIICVGGKGLNASVALRGLEQPSIACSFMAGQSGKQLEQIIENYGIIAETIWVDGETRVSYVIAEAKHSRVSHIITGRLLVQRRQLRLLIERYKIRLREANWVILGGSIPDGVNPEIYCELTQIANRAGVPVLIDSQGALILKAILNQPTILKMNWNEFNFTFQMATHSTEEILQAALKVQAKHGLNALVITCGVDGIIAVIPGAAHRVIVPPQAARNPAGAGDAASASLAWRLSAGDSWGEALKWAGAVSAASVLTEATGEVSMDDVKRILPQVGLITETTGVI